MAVSEGTKESRSAARVARASLTLRVAGEAGEGIKKPGELLIQAATRAGFKVLSDFSPPSEIIG